MEEQRDVGAYRGKWAVVKDSDFLSGAGSLRRRCHHYLGAKVARAHGSGFGGLEPRAGAAQRRRASALSPSGAIGRDLRRSGLGHLRAVGDRRLRLSRPRAALAAGRTSD